MFQMARKGYLGYTNFQARNYIPGCITKLARNTLQGYIFFSARIFSLGLQIPNGSHEK
jgi:hypothetical protein